MHCPLALIVQLLSRVQLFLTPWTTAHQAPLSSTISQSLLKFMSIESVMPSNHLILSPPLLLLLQSFLASRSFPVSLPNGTYIDLSFKRCIPLIPGGEGITTECSRSSGAAPPTALLTQAGSTTVVHSAPALGGLPDPQGWNCTYWCEYPCCLMAPFSVSVLPIPVLISCTKFPTLVSFSD